MAFLTLLQISALPGRVLTPDSDSISCNNTHALALHPTNTPQGLGAPQDLAPVGDCCQSKERAMQLTCLFFLAMLLLLHGAARLLGSRSWTDAADLQGARSSQCVQQEETHSFHFKLFWHKNRFSGRCITPHPNCSRKAQALTTQFPTLSDTPLNRPRNEKPRL